MANGKWEQQTSLDISNNDWMFDNAELVDAQNNYVLQGYAFPASSKDDGVSQYNSSIEDNHSSFNSPHQEDYSQLVNRISVIEAENTKMKRQLKRFLNRLQVAEDNIDEQQEYTYFLEKQLSKLDQYGRRENIEISGIPSNVTDRQLETEVLRILKQIGLKHLEHFHIVACHRIGSTDLKGNRNTIVRFINRKDAIQCLKLRRNLHLCKYLGYSNLFIMENLCPAYKSIFDDLTELKNEGLVKKVWSFNGTVNYKLTGDTNEKPVKNLHEWELENLYIENRSV